MTPPTVKRKSERVQKLMTPPLRRSERTKSLPSSNPSLSGSNSKSCSGSSGSKRKPSKKKKSGKRLMFEAEKVSEEDQERNVGTSAVKSKRMNARMYRAIFKTPNRDCHEDSNRMDKSTQESGNDGGGKTDEFFKGSHLDCKEASKDGLLPSEDAKAKEMGADSRLSEPVREILENNVTPGLLVPSNATTYETGKATESVKSDCCGEETLQMSVSRNSMLNENLIRNCDGQDKGENLISSKRKGTMMDMHSDVSATSVNDNNCNLIADACPSRVGGNTVGTSGPCSKRIRRISLSDVHRDWRKVINNVDQPSSKSESEKLSTGNKEGKSGDPADRPRGNCVESEKIRKLRDEQRSVHLLLKPNIAKLCEILLLTDNVKSMVDNFLEYVMNNHCISREPVSILQAFQISLCWTVAFFLNYKLSHKASLVLAKRHLNFDCEKEAADLIYIMLRCLKELYLYRTGNSNVTGSPKASASSKRIDLYTGEAHEVELFRKGVSESIEKFRKKCRKELKKLWLMQREEKQKLKAAIHYENDDFERRYKIESAMCMKAFIRSCSPNEAMKTEKLKVFNSEYDKRIEELKLKHEIRLKLLDDKHLKKRQMVQDKEAIWVKKVESWAEDELSNIVSSNKLGTGVEYLPTCDQAQPNGPKNAALVSDRVAEGKSFDKIIESMTRTGTGFGLSEASDTNFPLVVPCISPVELQTPLVKHAGANEIAIMVSEDGPISRNEGHNIAENECDTQGNIISEHSNSREQCSDGATSMADEGEGCENFSHESHDGCGDDTITLVLPSSNGEICDRETSDVPSGEVALALLKTSSLNDGQDVPSSRQGKLDGTISSKRICDFSLEVKANGFSDVEKNMACLNSQSPEELIPHITAVCMPNCENAVKIHKVDHNNDSNNSDTLNSPLSDERIASLHSKSPQEHVHSVIATCMPNCETSAQIHEADDGNGSNNAVTLNSALSGERIAVGTIVSVLDREVHVGMPGTVNFTHCPENVTAMNPALSMEQISGGAVNVSVLDRELSRTCGTASPSNGPDAITLLNQPSLEKQNPDGVSSSISAGQISVEVAETSHEGPTVSVLDNEAPVEMPGTVDCTDHPENITLNSSSVDQVSDGGSVNVSVLDRVSSSRHCGASSPSDGPATISLLNPPLEQHISDRVSLRIPDEQVPIAVPETSHEVAECHNDGENLTVGVSVDTAREMQNSLISSPVDTVPANQPNHVSLVMEPPEQMQQLPSAQSFSPIQDPSNLPLATEIEHRPTNEDAPSSHVPEASIEVPNQAVVQPASNLDLDSLMPSGVRTESSETRNLSTPVDINNHPIRTANQSASMTVPPLCSDPLKNEVERILKLSEQNKKNHEDMKLQLKSDFEKELEELRRKYDIKFQEIEVEFQLTKRNLDSSLNAVFVNKILAETFRSKCMDLKVSGTSGMQQDLSFAQQLFLLSRQQSSTLPSLVAGSSSCGPPAASLQSSSTTASSPTSMVPPTQSQAAYNISGIFSSVSARLPHVNLISSPSGNLQAGGEIRAPAPHLQPYRPSTSVPPSSSSTVPHGTASQPAPSNIPATSPSFSHCLPQLRPTTYQFDPYMGHWPESAGGSPTPNLTAMVLRTDANSQSGINLPNVLLRMSDVASLNLSRSGTSSSMSANSIRQATSPDVVCLSDDE